MKSPRRARLLEARSSIDSYSQIIEQLVNHTTLAFNLPPDFVPGLGSAHNTNGLTGRGSVVAVIDSGIDESHPVLKGAVVDREDFSGEGHTRDEYGHGTLVALLIRYVAPNAKLLNAKALIADDGSEEALVNAMLWSLERGATVVNMSAGVYFPDSITPGEAARFRTTERTDPELVRIRCTEALSTPVCEAVRQLAQANVVVCAAAGNCPDLVTCPACEPSSIVVGTAREGKTGFEAASYSGRWPDFVMPELPFTIGTSFSTPLLSGTLCLIQQAAAEEIGRPDHIGE